MGDCSRSGRYRGSLKLSNASGHHYPEALESELSNEFLNLRKVRLSEAYNWIRLDR